VKCKNHRDKSGFNRRLTG